MNKSEFLSELRKSLSNELPKDEIKDTMAYYEEYLQSFPDGQSRELDDLGDPRLIARSIIETYQDTHSYHPKNHYDDDLYNEEDKSEGQNKDFFHIYTNGDFKIPLKYKLYGIGITIAILVLLFFMLKSLFVFTIRYLIPILIVVLVVNIIRYYNRR